MTNSLNNPTASLNEFMVRCRDFASGEGKEHMALISALLSLPVGVRFTALTKDGVVFL